MDMHPNNYPKLHNATWPGVVGKGDGSEPCLSLETMLDLTAAAEVEGVKFDGVDLFLFDPHCGIDSTEEDLKRLVDSVQSRNLEIGSVVAPVWPPTGGGSAMGSAEDRKRFLIQVAKACQIARQLSEFGVRPHGVVRIDSAVDPASWALDPEGNQKRIAATFREACEIARDQGERLAAEGEICWGGLHSWRRMVQLLEMVDRRDTLGFQADMAHTLYICLGTMRRKTPWFRKISIGKARNLIRLIGNSARRSVPGRSICTLPRMMRQSRARGLMTRRAAIACRTTPMASWTLRAVPGIGCAEMIKL